MGYASERAAIEDRWKTLWVDGASPRTETAYENVPIEEPDTSWVRLTIKNGEGRQISAGDPGNNTHRYVGVIVIQIFTPAAEGTNAGRVLADHAADVFRNVAFGGVQTKVPHVAGSQSGDKWHQYNVTVPFWRDEPQ